MKLIDSGPVLLSLDDSGDTAVSALSGTADSREGLAAALERRKPQFTGR